MTLGLKTGLDRGRLGSWGHYDGMDGGFGQIVTPCASGWHVVAANLGPLVWEEYPFLAWNPLSESSVHLGRGR